MTTPTAAPLTGPLTAQQTLTPPSTKIRIGSIDILRGAVMLIMAIDHVRDMLHYGHPDPTDLQTTTPILFFTRWITHYCAPTFVFLSGISAYLAGKRRSNAEMAGFLIKRGLWLIFVDVAIITFATSIDPFYHVIVLQVIWAIGGSMILLGLLIRAKASPVFIGGIGLLICLGHNIIDVIHNQTIDNNFFWRLFLSSRGFAILDPLGPHRFLLIAYALLPWTGVMLVGYSLGTLYAKEAAKRKKIFTTIGLSLIAFFVVFRAINIYGDPAPWSAQKTPVLSIISFLNVTKYPCSLLYLCMTLGVSILILARTETLKGRLAGILTVYGNVPFFYYVCHWFLAQFITMVLFFSTGHHIGEPVFEGFSFSALTLGFPLGGVYAIWLLLITIMYFPCRWFGKYKKTHHQWWLSYL